MCSHGESGVPAGNSFGCCFESYTPKRAVLRVRVYQSWGPVRKVSGVRISLAPLVLPLESAEVSEGVPQNRWTVPKNNGKIRVMQQNTLNGDRPMNIQDAMERLATLDEVIAYMEKTPEASWRVGTVRSVDGSTNCFFGHLFNMGANDSDGNMLWAAFEDLWATTYMLYPVNDGQSPRYQQHTPRQRVLAYLRDLASGNAPTTFALMEMESERYESSRG